LPLQLSASAREAAQRLTDAQIDALAAYYAGL